MTSRRAQFTEVEVRRALKAAKAEGFKVVELTPTTNGLKIVARVDDTGVVEDQDTGRLD